MRDREPDGVPSQEEQQTEQVQDESTHLGLDRLKEELKGQKLKIRELKKIGQDLQTNYSTLVSLKATENDKLRKEVVNLQRTLEEMTHKLQDRRVKLQENAKELREVKQQRDDWIEHSDKLTTELNNKRIIQQHPTEKSLEKDLINSHLQLSKLREDLSKAEEAARAAVEKAKQSEDALEKMKIEAHKDRKAHGEARKEASKLQNSLEVEEQKAKECRLSLIKVKVVSGWRNYKIAKHEEKISSLLSQLANIESLHKKRDIDAQLREQDYNDINEQLRNNLSESYKRTEHLEHENRGLKELLAVKNDSPTDGLKEKLTGVNRQLQEAKEALCKTLEELEESRKELAVKSDECKDLRAKNIELIDEVDRSAIHPQPPGETVEHDLSMAYQDNSRLRDQLRVSQNTADEARESIKKLEKHVEEARRRASESQETGEMFKKQAAEYQKASSILRYEKLELETALQQAKVESNEVQKALHETEKEMTKAKGALNQQKRQLDGMHATMSAQEAEMSTLRQRLVDAEKSFNEANEQLTDLERCEGPRREAETEIRTLRELIGDKAEILKTMTPEGKLLLELLPISLRISGEYVGIFAIDACTIKMMIGIPEKDSEETIELVLQAIDRAGTIGEIVVTWEIDDKLGGHKLNQTSRTPSYIRRQMLRGHTVRLITQSNIEASILERQAKVRAARAEETKAKRPHTDQDPGEGRENNFTEWELTASGKRRKLNNSTSEGDKRY